MNNTNFWRIVIVIFMVRLALALLPSFMVDMGAWMAWAHRLASLGPSGFYSDTIWTQYTPGYLYWLWIVGWLDMVNPLAIKIPVILADIVTGWLIGKVVASHSKRLGIVMMVLYALHPIVIFDGSIWGQVDGILTLAMVGAAYALIEKKNYLVAYGLMGIALLIKLQAVAILPILVVLTWKNFGLVSVIKANLLTIVIVILGFWPFYPQDPLGGMIDLIQKMGVSYPYTSLFAFNIWTYIGMWIPDSTEWMGRSYFSWGVIAMGTAYILVLLRYYRQWGERGTQYLLLGLGCMIFFLFPTRVHERYLFPAFAFLLIYLGTKKKKGGWVAMGILSVTYLLNLYLPYSSYESMSNALKNVRLEQWITDYSTWIATLQLLVFGYLLFPGGKNSEKLVPVTSGHGKTKKQRGDK